MERIGYLELMNFPFEWADWGMIPDAFIDEQSALYQPGHENASEHDRHGVFQWWLRQQPPADKLVLLARLTWLDPDDLVASSVRDSIILQPNFNATVAAAIQTPYYRAQ
jgi:hypothetical protein